MAKKKQQSNFVGLAILAVLGLGIFQFGIMGNPNRPATTAPKQTAARPAQQPIDASLPLTS